MILESFNTMHQLRAILHIVYYVLYGDVKKHKYLHLLPKHIEEEHIKMIVHGLWYTLKVRLLKESEHVEATVYQQHFMDKKI
jgi:hypothetical protein